MQQSRADTYPSRTSASQAAYSSRHMVRICDYVREHLLAAYLWGCLCSQVQLLSHTACRSTSGPIKHDMQDQGISGSLQQPAAAGSQEAMSTHLPYPAGPSF